MSNRVFDPESGGAGPTFAQIPVAPVGASGVTVVEREDRPAASQANRPWTSLRRPRARASRKGSPRRERACCTCWSGCEGLCRGASGRCRVASGRGVRSSAVARPSPGAAQRRGRRGRGAGDGRRGPGPRRWADQGVRELRVAGAALVLHTPGRPPDAAGCGGGLRSGRAPSNELRDARGASPAAGAAELRSASCPLNEMRRPPMWRTPRFRWRTAPRPCGPSRAGAGQWTLPRPDELGGPWRGGGGVESSREGAPRGGAVRRRVGQAVRRSIVMSREISRSASAAVAVCSSGSTWNVRSPRASPV